MNQDGIIVYTLNTSFLPNEKDISDEMSGELGPVILKKVEVGLLFLLMQQTYLI